MQYHCCLRSICQIWKLCLTWAFFFGAILPEEQRRCYMALGQKCLQGMIARQNQFLELPRGREKDPRAHRLISSCPQWLGGPFANRWEALCLTGSVWEPCRSIESLTTWLWVTTDLLEVFRWKLNRNIKNYRNQLKSFETQTNRLKLFEMTQIGMIRLPSPKPLLNRC